MLNRLLHIALLSLFILLGSCVDPIDFEIDRNGFQLVVSGHIDTGDGPFYVQLQRTSELPFRYNPVPGARITLHDNLGNQGQFFSNVDDGIYLYNDLSMQIQAGRSYFIRIRLASGEVYESVPELLPFHRAVSDLTVEFDQIEINTGSQSAVITQNIMRVSTSTILEDPTATYYIRYSPLQTFRFDGTDFPDPFSSIPPPCYVNRRIEPERLELFTSTGLNSLSIPQVFLGYSEFDYAWITKNIVTVETHSITREAHEYWRRIRILLNNSGSIFDTPPAAVGGNIFNVENPDEEVLGYFEASNLHVVRMTKSFLDSPWGPPEDECLYIPGKPNNEYPRRCLDCSIIPGAQRARPSYY